MAAPARTSFISQPTGTGTNQASTSASGMSPELESTLALLSSHRSVLGYMLVSRGHPVSIIRHSGVVFEGEQGRKYASMIGRIVESVQGGLEEVHAGEIDGVSLISGWCFRLCLLAGRMKYDSSGYEQSGTSS